MKYVRLISMIAAGIMTLVIAGCQDNGDLNKQHPNSTYNCNYGNGSNCSDNCCGAGQTGSK